MNKHSYASFASKMFLLVVLAGCGGGVTLTPSLVPASVTPSPSPTLTQTATPTVTSAPTATLPAPTIEFVSPTPEGTIVGTPPIEVTALGDGEPKSGWFTPDGTMNVRLCPSVTCVIYKRISGGVAVQFFSVLKLDNGDVWMCLDPAYPDCNTYVAFIVDNFVFGFWVED